MWRKLLCQYCHEGPTRLIKSLSKWTTTINSSKRLWPFCYSVKNNILYQGYKEDWHDNTKYQFDKYEYNEEDVFKFTPEDRNIELKHIPDDTIPVDVVDVQQGWKVCHYQTPQPKTTAPAPIIDLVQFIKSQPAYISKCHANFKWEIPKAEVYQAMKDTKKIIMTTDRGAQAFKGSLEFVITDSKHKVLISCYGRAAGHDKLSFRTKASASLAAIRVLIMIAEYYKQGRNESLATNKLITLFTNSLGMVNKLNTINKYPTAHRRCAIELTSSDT